MHWIPGWHGFGFYLWQRTQPLIFWRNSSAFFFFVLWLWVWDLSWRYLSFSFCYLTATLFLLCTTHPESLWIFFGFRALSCLSGDRSLSFSTVICT
ncbi:hypothetical protein C8Q69DRAFT_21428 [Paecilomyces variotii]|uniref:Uncharacterized protein n=1 Tax=Byssochlamys spectabilis TaxID=264951 RepID=A0A443I5F8_BYSSP|nr:hypothetical protein C8Q69DRAFT_21428 [Paecilomyces variotii]RWQ99328.1 hypothetical protein C8Q69DRAFT_21428 [Paecilomyces variotii]